MAVFVFASTHKRTPKNPVIDKVIAYRHTGTKSVFNFGNRRKSVLPKYVATNSKGVSALLFENCCKSVPFNFDKIKEQ